MMFKSWPQMLLQKLQQSQKNLLSTRVTIINERVRKYIQPLLACWYVGCKLIMSTVKRFSPEFHIFPRSFASRPHIRPLDNFSAANITSLHTSRLEGFIYQIYPEWCSPNFKPHIHNDKTIGSKFNSRWEGVFLVTEEWTCLFFLIKLYQRTMKSNYPTQETISCS